MGTLPIAPLSWCTIPKCSLSTIQKLDDAHNPKAFVDSQPQI